MSDIVENTEDQAIKQSTLEAILRELIKLNILLQDVHDIQVTDEDIDDECD